MAPNRATLYNAGLSCEQLFELFRGFHAYSLNYVYKGLFNPALTDKILHLTENNMTITGECSKTQKRVYFVMVESLQNVTRHQDVSQTEENHAFFIVQNKPGEYDLTTGNVIESNRVSGLKTELDKINSLGQDELKSYYKDILENTGLSDKGGAGLGLIEMARRSGNKLVYDFEELNKELSYFYFKSKITSEAGENTEQKMPDNVKSIHKFTRDHHVHMIYQGIFTRDNLNNLLSMTEGGAGAGDSVSFRRRSSGVMIEMLQNICNHGAPLKPEEEGRPGMLMLKTGEGGCFIVSGNYIENRKKDSLALKIDSVNQSSSLVLEEMYNDFLSENNGGVRKGAGAGFINMRLKTGSRIEYSFHPATDQLTFMSMNVFIPY